MIYKLHVFDYKVFLFNISRTTVGFYLHYFDLLKVFQVLINLFTLQGMDTERKHKAALKQGYIK